MVLHLVLYLPPTSHISPPSCDRVLGIYWGANSRTFTHETAVVQVGLQLLTPLAVRKDLFSCEFLARLQELCLHGSLWLLSALVSWLYQVCLIPSGWKRICMYVCLYALHFNLPSIEDKYFNVLLIRLCFRNY